MPLKDEVELTIQTTFELARSRVEIDVQTEIGTQIHLTAIDRKALEEARIWRRKYYALGLQDREPGWDWKHEYYSRGRRSSSFTLAVWSGAALCALMIGQVSEGRVCATIHYLESDPGDNPLKGNVVGIATRFVEAIGSLVGCDVIRISRPVPRLIEYYMRFGYTIAHRRNGIVISLGKKMPSPQG